MAFLVWTNEDDAKDSLKDLDDMYGLPFEAPNGYKMATWDVIRESDPPGKYGFYKPEERLGKGMGELMGALSGVFDEEDTIPKEFEPEQEAE